MSRSKPEIETKLTYKESISEAVRDRGTSFIDGAILLVENLTQEQKYKMENPRGKNPKKYAVFLEDLNTIKRNWAKAQNIESAKQLDELIRLLVTEIKEHVYFNKKDEEKVNKELNDAENHVNWAARKPVESKNNPVYKDMDVAAVTRTEIPISAFSNELRDEWLSILKFEKKDRPEWFNLLPEWEQNYFKNKVNEWQTKEPKNNGFPVENLGEFLGSIPTTIRRYPGATNAYTTQVELEYNGEKASFIKTRSGVAVPFDLKKATFEERVKITKLNLSQLIAHSIKEKLDKSSRFDDLSFPILIQTLYSPPWQPAGDSNDVMHKAVEQLQNELKDAISFKTFLTKHKNIIGVESVKRIQSRQQQINVDILYSNRPVNKAKDASLEVSRLPNNKHGIRSKETEKTLELAVEKLGEALNNPVESSSQQYEMQKSKFLKLNPNKEEDFIEKYQEDRQRVLDSSKMDYKVAKSALDSYKSIDYITHQSNATKVEEDNAMAEKAALEQIIASKVGTRVGSCVSGKDREEMITEIAIAQMQFFLKHNRFPPPHSAKNSAADNLLREEFVECVARQYLNGHGQVLAGENSKGCQGLKNVQDVFGSVICNKIKELAPDYGIKIDPILDIQKMAGLNKRHPFKVKVMNKLKSIFNVFTKDKTRNEFSHTLTSNDAAINNPKDNHAKVVSNTNRKDSATGRHSAFSDEKSDFESYDSESYDSDDQSLDQGRKSSRGKSSKRQ